MTPATRDVRYRERGPEVLAALVPLVAAVLREEFDATAEEEISREAGAAAALFDSRRDVCVSAEADGRDVGVLLVVPGGGTPDAAVFTWLAVEGAFRGIGIGRELVFRGIEACRERGRHQLRAYAFAVSPAACRLYWQYGFRVASLDSYPVGSGARERIVFEKRLDPPAAAG